VHEDSPRRRRHCRPDRALRHAELADLAQLRGVWTLRDSVCEVGGEDSWHELLESIDAARHELGERTAVAACVRGLSVLYALHRCGSRGFRGVIGPNDLIAARVEEITGNVGGFSGRTARAVWRILERAGLVDRWLYGRGKPIEQGAPVAEGEQGGDQGRPKRLTIALSLTVVAVSYWSGPGRRRRAAAPVGNPPTVANLAANTLGPDQSASHSRDARATTSSATSAAEQRHAVSPVPGDDFELGASAPASSRGARAKPVPVRRIPWRPGPDAPNDLGNAAQALLYDLETTLIRHRRPDRGALLELAREELDPTRRIAAVTGAGPPDRGSGWPWDDWIWRWRGLPLADRQVVCARMILPALLGELRAVQLRAGTFATAARLSRSRCTSRPPEIGPRQIAQPPPRSSPPAPRVSRWRPDPVPDWLTDLQRRRGGEEG